MASDTAPSTRRAYLTALRRALGDAPAGMIRDALTDAEEFIHSEKAQAPDKSDAEIMRQVLEGFGAPEEVAAEYRQTEETVSEAMSYRGNTAPRAGGIFGVFVDPRTYGALFYMLFSLALGIFYFTWVVTGLSLSLGLLILIIGIPFALIFIGSVRILALVEGRIVEALLGVRMPRRVQFTPSGTPLWTRIKNVLTDYRTWSAMVYMLLMLPLGITYFTLAVTGLSVSVSFLFYPIIRNVVPNSGFHAGGSDIPFLLWMEANQDQWWMLAGFSLAGFVGLVILMHLARALGWLHGRIAEQLLVRL